MLTITEGSWIEVKFVMPEETRKTILVIDDDLSVQLFICNVLRQADYNVLMAQNASHALELCTHHPEPIHLLITDVLMPDMNGRELAQKAVAVRDSLGVLYVSGYVNCALLETLGLDSTIAFLHKPFGPNTLLRNVERALSPNIDNP